MRRLGQKRRLVSGSSDVGLASSTGSTPAARDSGKRSKGASLAAGYNKREAGSIAATTNAPVEYASIDRRPLQTRERVLLRERGKRERDRVRVR